MTWRALLIAWMLVSAVFSGWSPAYGDGPPGPTLVPPEVPGDPYTARADSSSAEEAARRSVEDDPSYRLTPSSPGQHTTVRHVALAAGVGLAAVAVWRGLVADDRAGKYDEAIFSGSSADYRESVRSAETERNVSAGLACIAFSVALLTFVY